MKPRVAGVVFAFVISANLLSPNAAGDPKTPLGGGAGITLNGNTACTLTAIGTDRAGQLVGFTADHCGGVGAPVSAQGADDHGTVGTVTASDDDFHYSVITFDPTRVAPVANFAGFAVNGIGPDPAPNQAACKQGNASGHDCRFVRPFIDSRPDRPTARIQASYQPGDDGGPVTSDDLLIGMIYNGFITQQIDLFTRTKGEIRILYINAILANVNAKGGPGAGFSPVSG